MQLNHYLGIATLIGGSMMKDYPAMRVRKSISMLGVAVTALAGVAVAANPASASVGGGCRSSTGHGITITACISASGNQVKYDMYISSEINCSSERLEIVDDTTGAGDILSPGCSVGHIGPFSVLGLNGHAYTSFADLWGKGWMVTAMSPSLHFSD